jgi:hypothetical protein
MIKVELAVQSLHMSPEGMTEALQCEPDFKRSRGEPSNQVSGASAPYNLWTRSVNVTDKHFGGPSGLSADVVALGADFADHLSDLAADGCEIVLSIVQDIENGDDRDSLGIQLSRESISWLNRARASLDLDQYLARAGDDVAIQLWPGSGGGGLTWAPDDIQMLLGYRLKVSNSSDGDANVLVHNCPARAGGGADDAPSWVAREAGLPLSGESAQQYATRILDTKYGAGNWSKGGGSEFSKIVKWATRGGRLN